jgi:effector-binding domain-containing protein
VFKIGEFSRLVQMPVKTLRYYDEIGLLRPAQVDESTGYRYYSADQLPRLNRILALRDLGFSLEQIARLVNEELSPAELRGMLRLREIELAEQAQEAQACLSRVKRQLCEIEKEGAMPSQEVVLKKVSATKVAAVREVIPTYAEVGELYREIFDHLGRNRVKPAGPSLAIYYDQEYRERDVDVEAAVPVSGPLPEGERVKVRELPAHEAASIVHQGSYEAIGGAYKQLMSWIEANGYRIVGPCREVHLQGPEDPRRSPTEYVTEVQFPVEKA